MKIKLNWSDFKQNIDSRQLNIQWFSSGNNYFLYAFDGDLHLNCKLDKDDTAGVGSDQEDFELNYKSVANQNLVKKDTRGLTIQRNGAFSDAEGFRARFTGMQGVATKNSDSFIDHTLTEERYINGVRLVIQDHTEGDSLDFQVVDTQYTYAGILYPADYEGTAWSVVAPDGVVLDQFGTSWFVDPMVDTQPDVVVPYPARVLAGLTIRIVYHSTGIVDDVKIKANLYLHKKAT